MSQVGRRAQLCDGGGGVGDREKRGAILFPLPSLVTPDVRISVSLRRFFASSMMALRRFSRNSGVGDLEDFAMSNSLRCVEPQRRDVQNNVMRGSTFMSTHHEESFAMMFLLH